MDARLMLPTICASYRTQEGSFHPGQAATASLDPSTWPTGWLPSMLRGRPARGREGAEGVTWTPERLLAPCTKVPLRGLKLALFGWGGEGLNFETGPGYYSRHASRASR